MRRRKSCVSSANNTPPAAMKPSRLPIPNGFCRPPRLFAGRSREQLSIEIKLGSQVVYASRFWISEVCNFCNGATAKCIPRR